MGIAGAIRKQITGSCALDFINLHLQIQCSARLAAASALAELRGPFGGPTWPGVDCFPERCKWPMAPDLRGLQAAEAESKACIGRCAGTWLESYDHFFLFGWGLTVEQAAAWGVASLLPPLPTTDFMRHEMACMRNVACGAVPQVDRHTAVASLLLKADLAPDPLERMLAISRRVLAECWSVCCGGREGERC